MGHINCYSGLSLCFEIVQPCYICFVSVGCLSSLSFNSSQSSEDISVDIFELRSCQHCSWLNIPRPIAHSNWERRWWQLLLTATRGWKALVPLPRILTKISESDSMQSLCTLSSISILSPDIKPQLNFLFTLQLVLLLLLENEANFQQYNDSI